MTSNSVHKMRDIPQIATLDSKLENPAVYLREKKMTKYINEAHSKALMMCPMVDLGGWVEGLWDFFEQVIMYKLYDTLERFAVPC